MLVLDINDAEITLVNNGEVLYREPGVAVVDRDGAVFGREALAKSRLHPRQTHNEFWQRLNADPVKPPGRAVANQADLVYLHLQAIRAAAGIDHGAETVVAAPGLITAEQLGLLLGIAAEAGLSVRAIVDSSLAAASVRPLPASCAVVDVSLHHGFVTRIDHDDVNGDTPLARRGAVDEVSAAGFAALVEGWVDAVADHFVERTRFDPLRIAHTEQQVFEQVIAGIEGEVEELAIDVRHDDVSRHVNVARRTLADKSAQRYELLRTVLGTPTTLALTHRVRRLPGLAAHLRAAGHEVVALPDDAVAAAVAEHSARIMPPGRSSDDASAQFITSLPARRAKDATATPSAPLPTHLLCGALALPLGEDIDGGDHPACTLGGALFRIKRGPRGVTVVPERSATVLHNGTRIYGERPATTGDAIACGNVEFRLIAAVGS